MARAQSVKLNLKPKASRTIKLLSTVTPTIGKVLGKLTHGTEGGGQLSSCHAEDIVFVLRAYTILVFESGTVHVLLLQSTTPSPTKVRSRTRTKVLAHR